MTAAVLICILALTMWLGWFLRRLADENKRINEILRRFDHDHPVREPSPDIDR